MGWIAGGSAVQSQVIAMYNAGLLSPAILDTMMEPFKETDCDTAGFHADVSADDGKTVEEIICLIMKPEEYMVVIQSLKDDPWLQTMEPEKRTFDNSEAGYQLFDSIWFGMWNIF